MGEARLRLVTGAPDVLEGALAAEVRERREADPLAPIGVLIGGTLQRPYLQRRLAELNDGIVNVHFLTQSELALALGERRMIAPRASAPSPRSPTGSCCARSRSTTTATSSRCGTPPGSPTPCTS